MAAPLTKRRAVKLNGSSAVAFRASRQSKELPANASKANEVKANSRACRAAAVGAAKGEASNAMARLSDQSFLCDPM